MINFIETLFGVAIVTALAAVVLYAMHRRAPARRLGVMALLTGAVGGFMELYVRM